MPVFWALRWTGWWKGMVGALLVLCVLMAFGPFSWTLFAYRSALEDAPKTIEAAGQFLKLYPDAECHFSYYTGQYGPPTWVGTTGLYGRYILQMQVVVTFSSSGRKVKSFGEPKCYLTEVKDVTIQEDGRVAYNAGATQVQFGPQEWKTLVENRGDLSSLGVTIVKDQPIPDFDKCWRSTPGRAR